MSYNIGDIVRIGSGKVEYTVFEPQSAPEGFTTVQSNNTGKVQDVETGRLKLVSARVVSIAEAKPTKVTVPETYNTPTSEAPARIATPGVVLWIDGVQSVRKTFDAAAFALSRATYKHAAIFRNGKRVIVRNAA